MLWTRFFGRRPRRDERGAVLVMAVPGLVLALAAMALSVDMGRQVFEKRTDQSVADAAALDASRNPANAQALAEASARRNGFNPTAPGHLLVAQRGKVDANKVFTADPTGPAVLVSVTSNLDYIFMPGDRSLTARAVAVMGGGKQSGFSIGTSLASLDTTKSALLNAVLGRWFGGTVDVVSWHGLVSSHVTLEALRGQLELLDAGVQFGTVDQLLTSDITMAELAQATAAVLTSQGDTNASLFAGPAGIIAQSTNTATFTLGEMIKVAAGAEGSALASEFNVFSLLTGSAMVANGSNAIDLNDIGITIPNVGSTKLSLKVIEPRKTYFGPDATVNTDVPHASTGQIQLTLTPNLNLPVTVAGLAGVMVTGDLPLSLTAAGADATLSTITCPNPNGGQTVNVDLKAVTTSVNGSLAVSANVLGFGFTMNASTTGTAPAVDAPPQDLVFSYPSEFYPTAGAKRVGSSPLGLGAAATFNTTASMSSPPSGVPFLLQATVNAALSVATPLVGPAISTALKPVLTSLDTLVIKPLLDTLGVSIGAADVTALKSNLLTTCGAPVHPVLVN